MDMECAKDHFNEIISQFEKIEVIDNGYKYELNDFFDNDDNFEDNNLGFIPNDKIDFDSQKGIKYIAKKLKIFNSLDYYLFNDISKGYLFYKKNLENPSFIINIV